MDADGRRGFERGPVMVATRIALVAAMVGVGVGRADDFAAWKAEKDATAALTAAAADPAKASELLKAAIDRVEKNAALSPTKREALTKRLREGLANPAKLPAPASKPEPVADLPEGGLVDRLRESAA